LECPGWLFRRGVTKVELPWLFIFVSPPKNGEFVRELAWALLDPTGIAELGALF
tara:strand:- start:194 stop:355 length:162 start_codon:yes stop_codon:yes gene_type:complete